MKIEEKEKECWELFSVPEVSETGYEDDMTKLIFRCKKTNTNINAYYPKEENINVEMISKIMRTVLSVCLHCTGKKPERDSGYIVY